MRSHGPRTLARRLRPMLLRPSWTFQGGRINARFIPLFPGDAIVSYGTVPAERVRRGEVGCRRFQFSKINPRRRRLVADHREQRQALIFYIVTEKTIVQVLLTSRVDCRANETTESKTGVK